VRVFHSSPQAKNLGVRQQPRHATEILRASSSGA
jgi:hypothetical protein